MPLTGYLTAAGIESALSVMASTYPNICQLITLPEHSIEQRVSRAVRIAHGAGPTRPGILVISGVHAREVVNPDMLAAFGLKLCNAYTTNTGLTFGGKVYDAQKVLRHRWDEVVEKWGDQIRAEFQERVWEPLDQYTSEGLRAMDRLGQILTECRRECTGER